MIIILMKLLIPLATSHISHCTPFPLCLWCSCSVRVLVGCHISPSCPHPTPPAHWACYCQDGCSYSVADSMKHIYQIHLLIVMFHLSRSSSSSSSSSNRSSFVCQLSFVVCLFVCLFVRLADCYVPPHLRSSLISPPSISCPRME